MSEVPLVLTLDEMNELVEHAKEIWPEECCGYLRVRDGRVVEIVRGMNTEPHGWRQGLYLMDHQTLLGANLAMLDGDEIVSYHSHPNMAPVPSFIDVEHANYPSWTYLIVGHVGSRVRPTRLRAWRIVDEEVWERDIIQP